jgi:plasmid maintenance system antidote protein VapI
MNHPSDAQLAQWLDGDAPDADAVAMSSHLETCDECQRVASALRDLGTFTSSDAVPPIPIPSVVAGAFRSPSLPDPNSRQLWQLEWNGEGVLALLVDVRDAEVVVAPATVERTMRDKGCVVIDAVRSPLGMETFVWMGLQTSVPLGVLSVFFGTVSGDLHVDATDDAAVIRRSHDVRAQYRAELASRLWRIADADTIALHGWNVLDLPQRLRERSLPPRAVAEQLDMPINEVTLLTRGHARISDQQLHRLSELLGVEEDDLIAPPSSEQLHVFVAVQHPRRREALRMRASTLGIGEGMARADVADRVLAAAARTAGGDRDVEQLIDDVLAE